MLLLVIKVFYKLNITNVFWNEVIEMTPSEMFLTKIEIGVKKNDQVMVCLYFKDGIEMEQAKNISENKIHNLTILLFYKLNVITRNYIRYRVEHQDYAEVTSQFDTKQVIYNVITTEEIRELKSFLVNSDHLLNNKYVELFYSAMSIHDSTAKYIFLYSILLQKYANYKQPQKEIDEYIRESVGEIEEKESTKHGNMETIYTWLRNQVGHTHENSDISEIRTKIEKHVHGFSELVKRAIF